MSIKCLPEWKGRWRVQRRRVGGNRIRIPEGIAQETKQHSLLSLSLPQQLSSQDPNYLF